MTAIFDTIKLQQEVYREGMAAFDDGLTLDDCPYDPQSTFGVLWQTGYEEAAKLSARAA